MRSSNPVLSKGSGKNSRRCVMGDGYRYLIETEYFTTNFRVKMAKKKKTLGEDRLCNSSAHRSGASVGQ